jgi:N-acyl-L-homoserine lactone synthetase/ubiquinone/menaquinone biosynthesis C-methylase UbiE
MPSTIEVLSEAGIEELWQKCCSVKELSFQEFCEHLYDSLSVSHDPFQRLIGDMIASWRDITGTCSRILCIGQSNEDFAIELARRDNEGGDLDFSRGVLMKGRLLKDSMSLRDVEFREWNMGKDLALYPESVFNYILSVHILHFLKEPEIAIREYFRVLKPCGGVILAEPRSQNVHDQIFDFDGAQMRSMLEAAGFRMNSIKSVASGIIGTAVKPRYSFEANEYRFVSAETREDIEKVFRLRYQVYCVELGVEPADSSGFLRDIYDEYATHFLAVDKNNRPVGTVRVVPNNPRGFPMDSDFPLTEYMKVNGISKGVEGGRFVIHKDIKREDRVAVAFGLFKCLSDYCREIGVYDIFTTTMLKIVKKYNMPGFKQIGEPFRYPEPLASTLWVPMHCDISIAYENYLKSLSK